MLALLAALTVGGGCTSEDPNPVGVDLRETSIDSSLVSLRASSVVGYGVLDVTDPDVPHDQTEVLYLGNNATESSSILASYDFTVLDHPDSAYLLPYVTVENVVAVDIVLYMLTWYEPYRGLDPPDPDDETYDPVVRPWLGAQKYYDVHALVAPLDTLRYPDDEPAYEGALLSLPASEPEPASGPIFIDLSAGLVVERLLTRDPLGVIIREGTGSDPGILGFASKEMVHGGSTLPTLNAQVVLGPALRLRLDQTPDEWASDRQYLILGPVADVCTWHRVEPVSTDPSDAIMVRTHLRSYPAVSFDLSALPPDVRVNRAQLVVVNDTTRSYGHRTVLTCSELPVEFAPGGRTTVGLDDFAPEVFLLDGNGTWEPEHLSEIELRFDVTQSIQRAINGAYEGERAFLLAAGEYFFPGWNADPDPDFWFTKWVFHGTGAAAELQPRLEISYSRLDELSDPEAR
jgi:hypothetical protein